MHLCRNAQLHLGFLLITFLAFVIGLFAFRIPEQQKRQGEWVVHTHEVRNQLQALTSHLAAAETGQRGYLLTGQAVERQRYLRICRQIDGDVAQFQLLTRDNPRQQAQVPLLRKRLAATLAHLNEAIPLRARFSTDSAPGTVSVGQSTTQMAIIQDQITWMQAEEQRLLQIRLANWERKAAQTRLMFLGGGAVSYLLICVVYFMLHTGAKQRKRLEEANAELKAQKRELEFANARLEALASIDSLTGLKNHRMFHERMREEYDRALRYNMPLSLLMLDVDRFKQHNDAFGHPAGDAILRQVAEILRETARSSDVVARYGGEEFALLLPAAGFEEARTVAERVRAAIEAAPWANRAVTVSIGGSTLAPATPHPDALLVDADAALYRSKHNGRNCVTHADDPEESDMVDTQAARWYNGLLQNMLASQTVTLDSASDKIHETLLQAYDATIESWSRILDLKDKETEGHSERVTRMMERLTRHLGMNEEEIMFARWGSWLHDIGKMAVPDCILHKPGPLTDEEWVIMRQHTTIAYEMLQPIEFLKPAIDIPYCHHEKWDGSGYPRGLKGDDIPLMARLFAVIDVYDALTSDRPYREAWPLDRMEAYLLEQAGTHFDPRAVEVFLAMLKANISSAPDCVPSS